MAPDLGVIEEWQRKDADYQQRLRDLEAATAARNQALLCRSAWHAISCFQMETNWHKNGDKHSRMSFLLYKVLGLETNVLPCIRGML